jgi:hypothetical protein
VVCVVGSNVLESLISWRPHEDVWENDLEKEHCRPLYWFPVASVSGMASMDLLIIPMPGNVTPPWMLMAC